MYIDTDYFTKAHQIIKKYQFEHYLTSLFNYWLENPTSLGHGFEHSLKAGVECFELAKLNDYPQPEELFVGGLLHDIFRPAEGAGGKEDHHEAVSGILKQLFPDDPMIIKLISFSDQQESWRGKKISPTELYDLYLFLGERACHTKLMTDAYAWASNQYKLAQGQPPKYTSHQLTLSDFFYYQLEVWDIFIKNQSVKGIERGMDSYLKIIAESTTLYQKDRSGEYYLSYLASQAEIARQKEQQYLEEFGASLAMVTKMMRAM
ncbi:MAG: HD domain-containing protein [bacterium]